MLCPKLLITALSVLCFSLFLHADEDHVIEHTCFSGPEFSSNGSYEVELNNLFMTLGKIASIRGYEIRSNYIRHNDEVVHGLAQCWAKKIQRQNCENCINAASKEVRKRCPHNKRAIIWYNDCLLKYSNVQFFGISDTNNGIYVKNNTPVNFYPVIFNQTVHMLLTLLCLKAPRAQWLNYHGNLKLWTPKSNDSIYGAAQCTRDLSQTECIKCLNVALKELLEDSNGMKGGRSLYGSCYVRFEMYNFYD